MENPLLRSGLALAGANTFLEHGTLPAEAEDGILTAEDVSGLDLLTTELVVLSACETGLGEIHVGEGVFGLRRAFVLAGAKTLVMSLWKVPDEQTRELMEGFYHRILSGHPRADALREAQLAMKKKYPDPFYWGAFICQGDPGPLLSHASI
jgi:CHAT domain-containing protein